MNVFNIILFIFWCFFGGVLYYRWFKKNSSTWNPYILILGFLFKVILGCVYGYIFKNYFDGDDTWLYHHQSLAETNQIFNDPINFLKSIFLQGDMERYEMSSLWKEIEYTTFIKTLAIFNLFSGGNYFLNVFLYNSIIFIAPILLCNLFMELNPSRKNLYYLIFFFFIPFVFWTSGIRREGFILLFLATTLLQFSKWLKTQNHIHLTISLILLLLLGIFRYAMAITAIPFLLIWFLLNRPIVKMNPWILTLSISTIFTFLFFLSNWLGPINLPGIIVSQQNDFLKLDGGSYIYLEPLKDNAISFLHNLPIALDHSFLRPYPFSNGSIFIQISTLESWSIISLLVYFFFSKPKIKNPSFAIPLIFFIIINYILLGYTVPFIGAIVRYRVIYETLLLSWLLSFVSPDTILNLNSKTRRHK